MSKVKKFQKILIANRGEIAARVMRTCQKMGISTVAVYSEADRSAPHVKLADEAFLIGPAEASESYLKADKILDIARQTKADAIHPGYGFLSENTGFARACEKAGIVFIGPSAKAISAMGSKEEAKRLMEKAGVPVVPGYHGDKQDLKTLSKAADKIGYPVLIKAVAGGGGKGMRKVDNPKDFKEALDSAKREGKSSFGNDKVLVEKFIEKPRHIEVQVFGDTRGNAVHLFERDCSLQRRHQKIIEEAPAPGMPEKVRDAMTKAAVRAAQAINYANAGTIEFIADAAGGLSEDGFYFMEMNTRLQVEHPVTEMVTGQDLVEWQIRVAQGEKLPLAQKDIKLSGHAVEVRLYAEDPANNFMPQTGQITALSISADEYLRVDSGIESGQEITVFYDPMVAKVIAWGPTRGEAMTTMQKALNRSRLGGLRSNLPFLNRILHQEDFLNGKVDTGFIDRHIRALLPETKTPSPHQLALAGLLYLKNQEDRETSQRREGRDPTSPWNLKSGFRLNTHYWREMTLTYGKKEYRLFLSPRSNGSRYIFREGKRDLPRADFSYENGILTAGFDDGKNFLVTAAAQNHTLSLIGADDIVDFTIHTPADELTEEAEGPGNVNAPMPGRILDVLAKNGQTVEKGTPLIIMEAMKMEYTLKAPRDGKVDGLKIKKGDQVREGVRLLEIKED